MKMKYINSKYKQKFKQKMIGVLKATHPNQPQLCKEGLQDVCPSIDRPQREGETGDFSAERW